MADILVVRHGQPFGAGTNMPSPLDEPVTSIRCFIVPIFRHTLGRLLAIWARA